MTIFQYALSFELNCIHFQNWSRSQVTTDSPLLISLSTTVIMLTLIWEYFRTCIPVNVMTICRSEVEKSPLPGITLSLGVWTCNAIFWMMIGGLWELNCIHFQNWSRSQVTTDSPLLISLSTTVTMLTLIWEYFRICIPVNVMTICRSEVEKSPLPGITQSLGVRTC